MNIINNSFNELKPLQKKHLEILEYVQLFCEKNKIEWSLAFGSALGAKRHGGPIPWDDDVDIYMTSENYNRFRNLFKEKGNKNKFYLQERISINGMVIMPKIRLNSTTFIEDTVANLDMHHGIYIDIFILHNAPKSFFCKVYGCLLSFYMNLKILSDKGYKKRKLARPLMWVLSLLPKNFGFNYILTFQYSYDKKDSNELADWFVFSKFIPKEVILPTKPILYDGVFLPGPNKIERYLEIWYGKWREIPNTNDIAWKRHSRNWSISEDFRKFAPNVHNFSDEMGNINNRER